MSIASLDQVKSMLRSMLGVTDRGIAKAQNDAKEAAEKATEATEKASEATEKASEATEKASEATEKASEALGLANAAKDGVASKMDATNPVGTGSFSMGRLAGSLTGPNSHAEGNSTTASGQCSHAEGNRTTASGYCSHAEGDSTTASGQRSHAEGVTTTASGYCSHAEGSQTRALGECQHVQGRYNIEDSDGAYAHIVGNGYTTEDFRPVRSNAHTLDWDGNAWFASDVYVGGSSQAEGEKLVKQSQLPTTDELVSAVIAKLPVATADTLGGVKVGKGLEMDGERLGVAAEKPMRLVNSVTLTEGVQRVEISTDENGKTFNAQALYAKITVSEKPAALALVGSGANPLAFVWTDRFNGAGHMWVGMFEHKAKRIFMTHGGYFSTYGASTTANMDPYTQGMGWIESEGFTQFYFHILSGTWPVGTKFELYEMGVS